MPNKKIIAQSVETVVDAFLARQKSRLSENRYRTDFGYLSAFKTKFAGRKLHEVTTNEISEHVDAKLACKDWGKRTMNDWLNTVSGMYEWAVKQDWTAANPASSKSIKREKLKSGPIGIFMPHDARKILATVEDDLKPFLACWMFGLLRGAEAARLNWPMLNASLEARKLYLPGEITKSGEPRIIPLPDNLVAWLMKYRRADGPLLPERWHGKQFRNLSKHIARKSGVKWRTNGPRHSSITFHVRLHKDPSLTAKYSGTSLIKMEKHYLSRSEAVTATVAAEWFDICPEQGEVVIMYKSAA